MDFVLSRQEMTEHLLRHNAAGDIPERITHNDTKVNNILMDDLSGEGMCVIDLDTVMPGLALYDFGDMVRAGTSPAEEDEVDLSKVFMRFSMYEALLRGYVSATGNVLTEAELYHLPLSGMVITLEVGMRFLTDYLEGDVYFKTRRPEHNLERCRNQFKLVSSMEEQLDKMKDLLKTL
jgi:aminoglycoside phosphotransferase (APT) family kinase protein